MEGFGFPVDTLSSSEGVFAPLAMPESELKAWMITDSQPMLPSLAALPPGSQFNSDLKTGGWQGWMNGHDPLRGSPGGPRRPIFQDDPRRSGLGADLIRPGPILGLAGRLSFGDQVLDFFLL